MQNADWLSDYALFRVLMEQNGNSPAWDRWPNEHQGPRRARTWLLSLPEAQQEAYLRRVEATDPARAADLRLILSANAEDLRGRGYCKAFGEVRRDVWGVAALMETPVDGRTVVFSCSVPSFSTDAERMSELGERLVGLIHGVEAQMGVVDHFAPLEFERPRARAAAHTDAKPAARKKVRSA